MNDCSICLKYEKPLIVEIRDIFSKTPDDTSDIIGKLMSVEEPREVLWGTPKKERLLKNAPLVHDSTSIKIQCRQSFLTKYRWM